MRICACAQTRRLREGMVISVKNKFFTREFVPAAQSSQVERRYGY